MRGADVKRETIAIHGGYDADPTTKAVAVPIYQTVAYAFDSADHGAALFNLEVEGYRYTPHRQPDHGGAGAARRRARGRRRGVVRQLGAGGGPLRGRSTSPGWAATSSRCPSSTARRTRCSPTCCPNQGVTVRFAASDRPEAIEQADRRRRRARVFCESVGNPAGNICDIEALARVAHQHGVPLIVDNTVATPILLRPIEYGADIVVHSLTKFMGGHGTTLGGAIVDSGRFPWKKHARALPDVQPAGPVVSRHGLHRPLQGGGVHRALPQRLPADDRIGAVAAQRVSAAAGHRDRGAAGRAARGERQAGGGIPARRSASGVGQLRRIRGQRLLRARAEVSRRPGVLAHDLRRHGRIRGRARSSTTRSR